MAILDDKNIMLVGVKGEQGSGVFYCNIWLNTNTEAVLRQNILPEGKKILAGDMIHDPRGRWYMVTEDHEVGSESAVQIEYKTTITGPAGQPGTNGNCLFLIDTDLYSESLQEDVYIPTNCLIYEYKNSAYKGDLVSNGKQMGAITYWDSDKFKLSNVVTIQGEPGTDGTDGADGKPALTIEGVMQSSPDFLTEGETFLLPSYAGFNRTPVINDVFFYLTIAPNNRSGIILAKIIEFPLTGGVKCSVISVVETTGAAGADGADGQDGVGIESIEKTDTQGVVDTYTITLTNGQTYTFTVTNGIGGGGGGTGGVHILDLSAEGTVLAINARAAITAYNGGTAVLCNFADMVMGTLTSVVGSAVSMTGNTVLTFLADLGGTIIKFTLEIPDSAGDTDELSFSQEEFGGGGEKKRLVFQDDSGLGGSFAYSTVPSNYAEEIPVSEDISGKWVEIWWIDDDGGQRRDQVKFPNDTSLRIERNTTIESMNFWTKEYFLYNYYSSSENRSISKIYAVPQVMKIENGSFSIVTTEFDRITMRVYRVYILEE